MLAKISFNSDPKILAGVAVEVVVEVAVEVVVEVVVEVGAVMIVGADEV